MSTEGGIVVEAEGGAESGLSMIANNGSMIVIIVLLLIVLYVASCKSDSFLSADGVVSRRSQKQVRDDPEVSREWNLAELEKSVALINRKAGN